MRAPPLTRREAPPPADEALARDFAAIVGAEGVSVDPVDRLNAARDMWPKGFLWERQGLFPAPPDAVLRPASVEAIAAVVRFASERGVPVTPYGAGSGVCGGAIPLNGGVTLRLDRLDAIGEIDPDALEVEAQAGVLGVRLEEALRAKGLTLGHFPSSIGCSSVGGWIAARSAGQSSSRYGKIEDMVRSMRCVLGTGEVAELRRPAEGIDRMELMLGSEGTLGVVVEARFRLWRAPESVVPRGFRFPSLGAGLDAAEAMFRAGLRPSVVRLYDPLSTEVALGSLGASPGHTRPPGLEDLRPRFRSRGEALADAIAGGPGVARRIAAEALRSAAAAARNLALSRSEWIGRGISLLRRSLLVLVHEGAAGEAEAEAAEGRAICRVHGGIDLGEGPGAKWLRDRWAVSYGLPRIFQSSGWVDTFEVAAPWGKVLAIYDAVRAAVAPHALAMAHFSHAYADGCSLYFTFTGAARTPEEGLAGYDGAWRAALDAALKEGATISHHHGVGLLKSPWLREELGEGGLELLRRVKREWDPREILNPGKLGAADVAGEPFAVGAEAGGGGRAAEGAGGDRGGSRSDARAFHLDRGKLRAIDPVDERAMWIRAYAGASVADVEARLRACGLTLGSQPPSIFRGTVGAWLEGRFAGRRVEGDRLATGVASVEAVLTDGLLFVSHGAPRSAAGPDVKQLLLGGEGRYGQLVAATLKAEPFPRTKEIAFAGDAERLARWLLGCVRDPLPPLGIAVEGMPAPSASVVFAAGTKVQRARVARARLAAAALGLQAREPPGVRGDRPPGTEAIRESEALLELPTLLAGGRSIRMVRICRECAVWIEGDPAPS